MKRRRYIRGGAAEKAALFQKTHAGWSSFRFQVSRIWEIICKVRGSERSICRLVDAALGRANWVTGGDGTEGGEPSVPHP
jgi:hypothetical protein